MVVMAVMMAAMAWGVISSVRSRKRGQADKAHGLSA
jgi:hypothetical protein